MIKYQRIETLSELKMRLYAQRQDHTWDWLEECLGSDACNIVAIEAGFDSLGHIEDVDGLKEEFPSLEHLIKNEMPWMFDPTIYTTEYVYTPYELNDSGIYTFTCVRRNPRESNA